MSLSTVAEVRFPSPDVQEDINFFTQHLGFRLDQIYPADQPAVAVLSGHGVRLRLETGAKEPLGTVRLLVDRLPDIANGASCIFAPNGLRVEFAPLSNPLTIPETEHTFVVRHLRDQA
ncbi:MAG: cupin, partial [Planctomycetota bacterium]|nr:cupin [Planctomycetota bacterium]